MTSFKPVTAVFPNGVFIDGARADGRLDGRVGGGRLIRAYDSATSLELQLADDDFEILNGGLLDRRGKPHDTKFPAAAWSRFGAARLPLDDIFFRLAAVDGTFADTGHTITVTFEDEVAALLRAHKGPLHVNRKDNTRAEFIGLMAAEVKETRVRYRSPEQHIAQNIKDDHAKADAEKERDRSIGRAKVTIKGVVADPEQRSNIATVLGVADHEQAGDRATLALLVACIQESTFRNLTGGDADSQGILQVRRSTAVGIHPPLPAVVAPGGLAHGGGGGGISVVEGPSAPSTLNPRDVAAVARTFLRRGFWGKGGAIKIATDNPDFTPGQIAQQVQGSAFPSKYDPWAKEAQAILDAYGGIGRLAVTRHAYNFRRAKGETSWAASDRLANEVRWRRWADRNVLWYVSDDWLFQREPVLHVERGVQARFVVWHGDTAHTLLGVSNYRADVGRPVSEMTITSILNERWAAGPGAVVVLEDLGPLNGRWLIYRHELDLFSGESTIIIRRPQPKLPEPAANRDVSVLTESRPEAGSPRQRIVAAAKKALSLAAYYRYEQVRPMPDSLFPGSHPAPRTGAPIPDVVRTDCSGFATLVYKAAGVVDPNGRGYDGYGNTATLKANGTRTTDPQPGDLAFYGNPEDVKVYIGGGEVIGMGGNPIHRYKTHDRWDFQFYMTFDLTDQGF